MTLLSRDAIIAAPDITPELVDVPEWGGQVYVRGLTGKERDAFEMAVTDPKTGLPKSGVNIRGRLALLGLCNEQGERLFADTDLPALAKKSALALERVVDHVRHLSGMTDEDLARIEGNSDGQGDASPSA